MPSAGLISKMYDCCQSTTAARNIDVCGGDREINPPLADIRRGPLKVPSMTLPPRACEDALLVIDQLMRAQECRALKLAGHQAHIVTEAYSPLPALLLRRFKGAQYTVPPPG